MFELFTDDARHVIVRAQEWTREWGMAEIGTAGLLAALAGAEAREAGAALVRVGVTDALVQRWVQEREAASSHRSSGHIPFSARFRRTLDRAAVLAVRPTPGDEPLGGRAGSGGPAWGTPPGYPGPRAGSPRPGRQETLRPGHLLLAMLDDPECTAVTILTALGVDLDQLRISAGALLHSWPDQPRGRTGRSPASGDRPAARHRPAGTSRFPPPDDPSSAGPPHVPPDDRARTRSRGRRQGPPGGVPSSRSGVAAAGAAWAELQRRQARLPLWALRLWRGDEIIMTSEARAAHRLTGRLPLSADERHRLARRHAHAVREIVFAALERQGSPARTGSMPVRLGSAAARFPRAAAAWAMRKRPRPLRAWVTWFGRRWTAVLARCVGVLRRP